MGQVLLPVGCGSHNNRGQADRFPQCRVCGEMPQALHRCNLPLTTVVRFKEGKLMRIPAVCTSLACGIVFESGMVLEKGSSLTLMGSGRIYQKCPKCDSKGVILPGEYREVEEVIVSLLRNLSGSELKRVAKSLKNGIHKQKPPKLIKKRLSKEIPKLKDAILSIPENPAFPLAMFIIMLEVISMALSVAVNMKTLSSDKVKSEIIHKSYENYFYLDDSDSATNKERNQSRKPSPPKQTLI